MALIGHSINELIINLKPILFSQGVPSKISRREHTPFPPLFQVKEKAEKGSFITGYLVYQLVKLIAPVTFHILTLLLKWLTIKTFFTSHLLQESDIILCTFRSRG